MQTVQHLALRLNVFGISVTVECEDGTVLSNLRSDFIHFESAESGRDLSLSLSLERPPYDAVPQLEATVYTPRNISFRVGSVTCVDYSGRALALFDDSTMHVRIFSEDRDLLYEAAYLFLLSQLGELLDRQRLHRVHALGFSVAGKA